MVGRPVLVILFAGVVPIHRLLARKIIDENDSWCGACFAHGDEVVLASHQIAPGMMPDGVWQEFDPSSHRSLFKYTSGASINPFCHFSVVFLDSMSARMMSATSSSFFNRSEERRVGKECRSRWSP